MIKQLARLDEIHQENFIHCMEKINHVAHRATLLEYTTYSRLWEYPWLWFALTQVCDPPASVLDIGSERSPFPWFLALHGFNVTISDLDTKWWRLWNIASRLLHVNPRRLVLDARNLAVPSGSMDVCLSISVIEHIPDKTKVIAEAARVLRPGGWLGMTFDICEPSMGMTFPQWNGRALSMSEFDGLFRENPWFEPGVADIPWNVQDIPPYLAWNRTTAPHHNYITGGALVRRNNRIWQEPQWRNSWRTIYGITHTRLTVVYREYIRMTVRNLVKDYGLSSE